MNNNFLLTGSLSRKLYHKVAKDLPIIDYHNHLEIKEIAENKKYENISRLWIISDPYKHRAMRILGVPERYITGDATDYEKFKAWYDILPSLVGNPLYDWSLMELETVFGFTLSKNVSAKDAWDILNGKLDSMTSKNILGKFKVEYSAPCAAICDDLTPFHSTSELAPSLRADELLLPTKALLEKLSLASGTDIKSLSDYLSAINERLLEFKSVGCVFTDHALDNGFCFKGDDGENERRFSAVCSSTPITDEDEVKLKSYLLKSLLKLYAHHAFTVQLHIGAQRKTSSRLLNIAGAAGGYAAIGSSVDVSSITSLFDTVEAEGGGLPKILLFTLNPADNAVMATLSGSYSKDGETALISQGPAWWWCDHYGGIIDMLDSFTCHSVLSTFIGMTTDSRSILSFVRHDYFRRVLCEWVADMVKKGRMPNDLALLSETVSKICYYNAKQVLERK